MKSRILLAEDEKDINDLLCEHLTTQGYEVSTCFDGKSTLDKIEKFGPKIKSLYSEITLFEFALLEDLLYKKVRFFQAVSTKVCQHGF